MMKSKWVPYFPFALTTVVLLAFIAYLVQSAERYRELLNLSAHSLLLLLALVLLFIVVNGIVNTVFYRALSVPLSYNEGMGLSVINTMANLLPFAGGMASKAVYLKHTHKLSYARFLSATLALYVCFVVANGISGLVVLLYWWLAQGVRVPWVLFLAFASMVAAVLIFFVPANVGSLLRDKWEKQLLLLLDGLRILSQNRSLTLALLGLQVASMLLFSGRFWLAFHILSQDVTFSQCVLFAAATILTRLVSISPGGLGVREAIVAGLASVLGFDTTVSVVAVGIDRLVATVVVIFLGTIYTYVLSKRAARSVAGIDVDSNASHGASSQ